MELSIGSKKSQALKLSLIVGFVIITPLLSNSLRPTYLYFLFNLLIVALGVEAGLVSFFLKAAEDKKPAASLTNFLTPKIPLLFPNSKKVDLNNDHLTSNTSPVANDEGHHMKYSPSSAKIFGAVKVLHVLKSKACLNSTPSLFFIGGGGGGGNDNENEDQHQLQVEVDDHDDIHEIEVRQAESEEELFHKAEMFIGNFYNQLKMQREHSLNKIHGLCQKPF